MAILAIYSTADIEIEGLRAALSGYIAYVVTSLLMEMPMNSHIERTPEEWRDDLCVATMMHVAFDGWSDSALKRGAQDLGLPDGYERLVFPRGRIDVIDHMMRRADRMMLEELERRGVRDMRIRDRISQAIWIRLEQAASYREAVRSALVVLALPSHAPLAARSLWKTADCIWHAAGDTASDYNHYTKRATLSAVYSSTLLCWLGDDSDNFTETAAFLDRRIDNVMQFEKLKAGVQKSTENLPSLTRFLGRLRYPAR